MMHFFPVPYKNELINSILSRYSLKVGNTHDIHDFDDIFGDSRTIIATYEVPTSIDKLVNNLPPNSKITSGYLIKNHSLLPYYLAFRSIDNESRTINLVKSGNAAEAYSSLGLSGYRMPMNQNFKFCAECNNENIESFGELYWDRVHQIDGILVCYKHNQALQDGPSIRVGNRQRHIPFTADIAQEKKRIVYSNIVLLRATEISKLAYELITTDFDRRNPEWFTNQIRLVLIEKGYSKMNNFIDQKRIKKEFIDYYGSEYLETIGAEVGNHEHNWLSKILRTNGANAHTLKILLVINFLGVKLKDIFEGYVTEDGCTTIDDYRNLWDDRLTELVALDLSLREICKILGASSNTVRQSIKRLNLKYDVGRRYNGGGRHVGKTYTDTKDFLKKRNSNRENWMMIKKANPDDSNDDLRKRSPVVYRWLMKYDKDWLKDNSSKIKKVGVTIDWEKRDEEYLEIVRKIVSEMEKDRPEHITYYTIAGRIGNQGWFAKSIDKMPQIKSFLDGKVQTLDEFHEKRIEWAKKQMISNNIDITRNKLSEVSGINRRYLKGYKIE